MSEFLWTLTATELVAGFRLGVFSPLEVLDALQERFEAVNPALNAVIAVDWTASRQAAAESTARWQANTPLSEIDGVPLTIKDNLYVAGLPATWGSVVYKDFVPDADEPPVARLRAAGMVIIGKTNVPELTLQGFTDNALFGPSFNPHAPDRTPGGSSGGACAAVASGLGPLAIGTDGGGSLRRPAAHCGLFAFKPSIGQVGRSGGFPQLLADFEVVGPVARSLDDLIMLFGVLRGVEPSDERTLVTLAPPQPYSKLHIGYFRAISDLPVDPAITAAADAFASSLAAEGHYVVEIDAPFDLDATNAVWGTVAATSVAWLLERLPDTSGFGANALNMQQSGHGKSAADLLTFLAGVKDLRVAAAITFQNFDLLLCPSIAALAWPAHEAFPPEIDGRPAGPRGHAIFTAWMNVTGVAALNLPVAMTETGGGIGLQLVAATGRDNDLLAFCQSSPTIRALSPAALSKRI